MVDDWIKLVGDGVILLSSDLWCMLEVSDNLVMIVEFLCEFLQFDWQVVVVDFE